MKNMQPEPNANQGNKAMNEYINDISQQTAERAFNGTSFSPDRRGESLRREYANDLASFQSVLEKYMKGEDEDKIDEEFERFRSGLKQRYLAYCSSHSRCMSAFIVGPARFPSARMQKYSGWADNKMREISSFIERAEKSVKRRYFKDPNGPIKSSDPDAVERLEAKLSACRKTQETMKAVNAVIRKAKGDKDKAMAGLIEMGLSEQSVAKILTPDYCGRIGFQSFRLSNNNAEIKRLEVRLRKIKTAKETTPEKIETQTGILIEKCPEENRIRLYFPDKPDETVRGSLKANGFRWSPRLKAWQSYINWKTERYVQKEIVASQTGALIET